MSDFQSEYESSILFIRSNNQHAYGNKSKRTKLVFVKKMKSNFLNWICFIVGHLKWVQCFWLNLRQFQKKLDQLKLKLSIIQKESIYRIHKFDEVLYE